MATKGLIRSGEMYNPICYNDEGVYNYFYIDFRRALEDFSFGMFSESVVVHDSVQLPATDVDYVSPGVYKVWCDISDKIHGITVLNKKTSLLTFYNGQKIPAFSTHFFVAGQARYINGAYLFGKATLTQSLFPTEESVIDIQLWGAIETDISENCTLWLSSLTTNESVSITLT
jgi:hypothetical protein